MKNQTKNKIDAVYKSQFVPEDIKEKYLELVELEKNEKKALLSEINSIRFEKGLSPFNV
ncbi:MAG: hypothetical protein AAFX53_19225 [Bacteroidota bacterium]